jgi:hypothetical protein
MTASIPPTGRAVSPWRRFGWAVLGAIIGWLTVSIIGGLLLGVLLAGTDWPEHQTVVLLALGGIVLGAVLGWRRPGPPDRGMTR